MQASAPKTGQSLVGPIGASVLVHLFVLSLVPAFGSWSVNSEPASLPREKILHVKFPSPDRADRPMVLDDKGELVDIINSTPSEAKAPTNARFLSDKNRTVDKETQARFTGPNPMSPIGKAGSSSQDRNIFNSPKRQSRKMGSGNLKWDIPESILEDESKPYQNPSSHPGQLSMLAPSNYLPEIAIGDQTLLDTREYVYASFYIRMKRQMEAAWDPHYIIQTEHLARDQYVTTLQITLMKDGSLRDVRIARASGSRRLDEEALNAVKLAAPYLNPPTQLVDDDDLIHIPDWHFIVTLGALF